MKTTIGIIISAFEAASEDAKFDKEFLLTYFKERLKEERSDIERAYNAGKLNNTNDCDGSKYYFMNYITND